MRVGSWLDSVMDGCAFTSTSLLLMRREKEVSMRSQEVDGKGIRGDGNGTGQKSATIPLDGRTWASRLEALPDRCGVKMVLAQRALDCVREGGKLACQFATHQSAPGVQLTFFGLI
ncbi:hypothetical protein CC1G_05110 [Coprinopsis cinerea okayama7|uniref:Uncharacterized protein n=1 Tax=Coprinopsis cinerea (strain Okayama-7 / 130 / ATCC MYA-4618 / FGSC 9003) TaxID=240176 RepID=A8NGD2_COPC7|nr:hypothetical protein CC1G_05110 [Coprinopsis cinerea okayama7\|eukprot:XP_001833410.2 hypothetical protein CC1G_05110 [Coprinopsis cinerea okayama7\